MRRDDAVGQMGERVIGPRRLLVEHVGAVAADATRLEGGSHVGRVHDLATGAIEDEHARFHLRDRVGTDQVAGFRREIRVERDVVGLGKQFVERRGPFDPVLHGERVVPVNVVADRLHSKRLGPDRHLLADPPHADDPDRLVEQFVAGLPLPAARPRRITVEEEVLLECQEQKKRVLGDGRMVHARREQQRNPKLRAALDVDLVDTDAVFGEYLQPRPGLFKHGPGDQVVAADVAVDVADESERVSLGQRAAGRDDLPAGGGELRVVLARGLLERGRREQDAGLHGASGRRQVQR